MKIALLQASSQREKNKLLYDTLTKVAPTKAKVINLGLTEQDTASFSYVEISLLVALLLNSKAVDFVVTGCSSGQGMMLACNSWPGVLCGYTPTPADAFLFGRINGGNAISLPLGLGFGWCGELNLEYTLAKLFEGDFGSGYPATDSARKQRDTQLLKQINKQAKKELLPLLREIEPQLLAKALSFTRVIDYILTHGTNSELVSALNKLSIQEEEL